MGSDSTLRLRVGGVRFHSGEVGHLHVLGSILRGRDALGAEGVGDSLEQLIINLSLFQLVHEALVLILTRIVRLPGSLLLVGQLSLLLILLCAAAVEFGILVDFLSGVCGLHCLGFLLLLDLLSAVEQFAGGDIRGSHAERCIRMDVFDSIE